MFFPTGEDGGSSGGAWVMVVVVVGLRLGWLLWGHAQSLTAKKKKNYSGAGYCMTKRH